LSWHAIDESSNITNIFHIKYFYFQFKTIDQKIDFSILAVPILPCDDSM